MDEGTRNVLMIATRDTKKLEAEFIGRILEDRGLNVIHLDASIRGEDHSPAAINPAMIAAATGRTMDGIRALRHEGECLVAMTEGAIACARRADAEFGLAGIIGMGGSMGTTLATAVMRTFPYGLPKVMISTIASGFTRPYVGCNDIMMVNPVCDIAGFNSITQAAYRNGALAVAAQALDYEVNHHDDGPLVTMTTLSTTDPFTVRVRRALEADGCEVMVFHTLGTGGMAMDEIVRQRQVAAVIDASLLEINDLLHGGPCSAGPDRCKAALAKGVPTFFVPGNADFISAGPIQEAARQYPGRRLHMHNVAQTAVRTRDSDMVTLADHMAGLIAMATGPVSFHIPLRGFSEHDSPRGHLHEPLLPAVLADHLCRVKPANLQLRSIDCHINDPEFADVIIGEVLAVVAAYRAARSADDNRPMPT